MKQQFVSVTVSSPTNIAVIKYWGKRDGKLNLPINSSVSVTIDQADLCTTTTVTASVTYERDRLWLNGEEEDVESNKRVQRVLKEVRARARDLKDASGQIVVRREEWRNMRVHVVSKNNFPTAAGLASSAAGYAALAFALSKLHGVVEEYDGELSTLARIGSGSACRSLHGGFTAWDMGQKADGSDSKARLVAEAGHWPELKVLILVVSDTKKAVSSTAGMQTSVETSPLLAHRAEAVVPKRMEKMEAAYLQRDFASFAAIAMQDSNQFHATCLDTFHPIFYLNDTSRAVIQLCHAINDVHGKTIVGYTFDAGPNAVLFALEENMPIVIAAVLRFFPPPPESAAGFVNKPELARTARACGIPKALEDKFRLTMSGAIKYVYATGIGPGAYELDKNSSLADSTGMPLDEKTSPPAGGLRGIGLTGIALLQLGALAALASVFSSRFLRN
jgi:diphosphomevalonate decarboxylase